MNPIWELIKQIPHEKRHLAIADIMQISEASVTQTAQWMAEVGDNIRNEAITRTRLETSRRNVGKARQAEPQDDDPNGVR